MKLHFPGTRGYHELRTDRHRMHTCLAVEYRGRRVVVDCGEDWLGRVETLRARAIVVTHAHPDHVGGLADGAPCPIYATPEAWEAMADFPIRDRREVRAGAPVEVEGIRFDPFGVEHSTRAPAVGYRVSAGRVAVFYAPDVVYVRDRARALAGTHAYVGDGATVSVSFVRKRGAALIGHAPVRTQLGWCEKEGVPRAIVTHCGREIVEMGWRRASARIRALGTARGVRAELAYDGMEVVLR